MAKGKFSSPRNDGEFQQRSSRSLREDETVVLPKPTANPLDAHEDPRKAAKDPRQTMPEVDFSNLQDMDLDDLIDFQFPELSSLDTESQDQDFESRFTPIPPRYIPTEEEKIEQAFNQAVGGGRKPPRAQKPQKSRRRGPGFWQKHWKKVLVSLVSCLVLVFLGLGGFALYQHFSDPYDHLILKGVQAAGVDLSGMTKDQAKQAVASAADPILSGNDMVVRLPDQTLTLSPAATKVSLDAGAVVKAAYDYGRSGSAQEKEEAYRNSLTGTYQVDLKPFLKVDESYVKNQLQSYADSHDSSFVPSSYALEGQEPPLDFENFNENNTPQTLLLILGNPGFHLDAPQALEEILTAYANLDMDPTLKLQAGDQAPEELDLNKIHEEYHVDPVDSSMDQDSFEVISGSYGYTFDLEAAREMLQKAEYGDTVRVPMEYVMPDTMDDEVYFQDVLSTAETPHGKNENRNENLRVACAALDGLVLNPGDEFSYNDTLGQRTADKGYKPAPAYSGNKLVDSLGGGICQVSSTLYYSCLLADLQITDRINHGFLPSYIDPGMDATVSWGRPDFKFRNNSDFPIKIHAETTEDKVIIQILGTDNKDYYIKMEYEMSDTLPNEVYEEYDADSGYYDGQVIDAGTLGHYVKTYRCKYSKKTDVLISRDLEARSSYMSRDKIIAVVHQKPQKPEEPEEPEVPETEAPVVPPDPPETEPVTPPDTEPQPEPETPAPDNGGEGGGDTGDGGGDPPAPEPDPEPDPEPAPEEGGGDVPEAEG